MSKASRVVSVNELYCRKELSIGLPPSYEESVWCNRKIAIHLFIYSGFALVPAFCRY